MNFLKKLAVLSDLADVITSGIALANIAATAVRPPLDKLVADGESFLLSPSFDGVSLLVTDSKAITAAAETSFAPDVPELIAFKSAVAALELEL